VNGQRFALVIDGRDWYRETHTLDFTRATTNRAVQGDGASKRVPGRLTHSLNLTMVHNEDTEALVGAIPVDGLADFVMLSASCGDGDGRLSVTATRFDATTLPPPWNTTREINGVEYLDSSWFVERVSSCTLPSLAT